MLVEQYKTRYSEASRFGKSQVAAEVVAEWRKLQPKGRFLTRTDPAKVRQQWRSFLYYLARLFLTCQCSTLPCLDSEQGDESTYHDIGDKE